MTKHNYINSFLNQGGGENNKCSIQLQVVINKIEQRVLESGVDKQLVQGL